MQALRGQKSLAAYNPLDYCHEPSMVAWKRWTR